MGNIAGVSQVCEILEVLRCTDDKFCDHSGADASALQQVEEASAASGSAESTVARQLAGPSNADLCTSMARMLSGHWPSLDLLASALTPVLRDMEASIEVELKK